MEQGRFNSPKRRRLFQRQKITPTCCVSRQTATGYVFMAASSAQVQQLCPPIVSSSKSTVSTRCQLFFFFLLSNYFCSYHFPFMSAPITLLLAARGLWIQTRLAGRLADNIAINQRVVAPHKRALTGPHQGFLRLIMTVLRSLFAEMQK